MNLTCRKPQTQILWCCMSYTLNYDTSDSVFKNIKSLKQVSCVKVCVCISCPTVFSKQHTAQEPAIHEVVHSLPKLRMNPHSQTKPSLLNQSAFVLLLNQSPCRLLFSLSLRQSVQSIPALIIISSFLSLSFLSLYRTTLYASCQEPWRWEPTMASRGTTWI